jgi:hypothetical protein
MNPVTRAALERAIEISCDVEVQMTSREGFQPVLALLERARIEAADAIVALTTVDADEPKAIRQAQNRIACFDMIVGWLNELVAQGKDADVRLSDEDRADIAESIGLLSEDEAEQVRLSRLPQTED